MKNLPEEVISEILLRLPVKSLLRFRSVSKSWLSLISNPQFTKSHFELSSMHTTNRLIYVSASEARSIDFNASFHDESAHVNLNFPLTAPPYYVQVMGSCRGLLLLTLDNNDENLFVWNPLTGVPKRLSYSLISSNRSVFSTFYGFGYDESTDDYLVVLAWYNPRAAIQVTQVEFLSLRTNSWKTIEGSNFPHANMMNGPWAGSLLNGAIHWLIFHEDGCSVIVAFDLAEKKLQEVPMPDDVEDDECCDLGVLAGCLSLCNWGIEPIEIWIMKEYGVKSSWSKSIVLCTDKFPTSYFTPICFTNGAEIVGIDGYTSLLKCNYSGELLEHFVDSQYRYGCKAAIYAESLLSFPNDHGEI